MKASSNESEGEKPQENSLQNTERKSLDSS
jgi:hypothetical protein